jgi:hypothetical protein
VVVVAAGGATDDEDRLAAVVRAHQSDVGDVEDVGVAGVDGDAVEVPGAAGEALVGVGEGPGGAAVGGDVETGFFGFDQRVDAGAVRADGDADAAPGAFGEAMASAGLPGLAGVE